MNQRGEAIYEAVLKVKAHNGFWDGGSIEFFENPSVLITGGMSPLLRPHAIRKPLTVTTPESVISESESERPITWRVK